MLPLTQMDGSAVTVFVARGPGESGSYAKQSAVMGQDKKSVLSLAIPAAEAGAFLRRGYNTATASASHPIV